MTNGYFVPLWTPKPSFVAAALLSPLGAQAQLRLSSQAVLSLVVRVFQTLHWLVHTSFPEVWLFGNTVFLSHCG